MQYRNTDQNFGVISIIFHWLGGLGIIFMLSTALMMASSHSDRVFLPWMKFHGSVGTLILPLLVARIIWHFIARQPGRLSDNSTLNRVATVVHTALLSLIAVQVATGLLFVWSGDFPLRVFDAFTLPSLTSAAFKAQHDTIGDVHRDVGLAIGILVALHLIGVFKHLVVDGDDTLARMIGMSYEPAAPHSYKDELDTGVPPIPPVHVLE